MLIGLWSFYLFKAYAKVLNLSELFKACLFDAKQNLN